MKNFAIIFLILVGFHLSFAQVINQNSKKSGLLSGSLQQCVGRDGRDGKDGINGQNGINGKDGRDGRDGRDGVDGENGVNGKRGLKGKDGRDGINGKDGVNGTNGVNGKDGKDGRNGKDGLNGKDALRNWKECAWKTADGRDNGVIKTCNFRKILSSTHLKIVVASNMRITSCQHCCKRWFVTIDGSECSDPAPIDGAVYTSIQNDIHRPRVIMGHCKITKTGTLTIALNVGNCPGYGNADAYTGWNSSSRIFIEEVNPPQS